MWRGHGIIALAVLMSGTGFACTCMAAKKDVKATVRGADFVFRGVLTTVDYLDPERSVAPLPTMRPQPVPRRFVATFEVKDQWKGALVPTLRIHGREGGGDCIGFFTGVGSEYLVFAYLEVLAPTPAGTWRLLPWGDIVPFGSVIVRSGEGCGLLNGNTSWDDVKDTLKRLGQPLKPPK
jgi:hypothetical protein